MGTLGRNGWNRFLNAFHIQKIGTNLSMTCLNESLQSLKQLLTVFRDFRKCSFSVIVRSNNKPLSAKPTKWSDTLSSSAICRRIVWVCLIIFLELALKGLNTPKQYSKFVNIKETKINIKDTKVTSLFPAMYLFSATNQIQGNNNVTERMSLCYVDLKFLQKTYESSIFSFCHPLFRRYLFCLYYFLT